MVVIIFATLIFSGIWFMQLDILGANYIKQYYKFFLVGYVCACISKEKVFNVVKCIFLILIIYSIVYKVMYGLDTLLPTDAKAYLAMAFLYLLVYEWQKILNISEKNVVCWLGKNSLYIYLYQFLVLNIGVGTGIVKVISIFCTATILSILLVLVFNRSAKIRALLFGEF